MKSDAAASLRKRVLRPQLAGMRPHAAREILQIKFTTADQARVQRLIARSSEGKISEAERATLELYLQLGHIITLMQSQARIVMKRKLDPRRKSA